MEAIVFIILQIFFTAQVVSKIGEYPGDIPQFSKLSVVLDGEYSVT